MSSVVRVPETDALEMDADRIDSLLADSISLDRAASPAACTHTRIKFVPGSGFLCADCAMDISDLD